MEITPQRPDWLAGRKRLETGMLKNRLGQD